MGASLSSAAVCRRLGDGQFCGKDIAQATFTLNNVNDQIVDLYPAQNSFDSEITIRICLFPFKSDGRFLAFILVYEQGYTQPARLRPRSFSGFLTIRIAPDIIFV
jgi:hypothetical protein